MRHKTDKAFTLVEVAVTLVIVVLMTGTAMTILDRLVGAMMDMRLHSAAFEIARQNMETLLSQSNVRDHVDYGVSETHPEIQWQTVIEPFYEPTHNALWVRAICSAGYTDSEGEYQSIELEHWLTNLPGNVVRQILQQQRAEEEYLNLLSGTAAGQGEAAIQETTIAYLQEAGLNVDEYTNFLERQRRQKLDYIASNGFDGGYDDFLEKLREEENRFLQRIGVDLDDYNEFARNHVPTFTSWDGLPPSSGRAPGQTPSPGTSDPSSGQQPPVSETPKVWTADDVRDRFPGIPEKLVPPIVNLMNS